MKILNVISKHKKYCMFIVFIAFVFSFVNFGSYTYSLYITKTKESYDVRELQVGQTIPFGSYLTGQFYKTSFVNYGYGDGTNSFDSFNVLYCEDALCTDGYVVTDAFVSSYKVKEYSEVFGTDNEDVTGWAVNLLETKSEGYTNYYYQSILEKDLILYPSTNDNCCCSNGVEKIYDFVKLVPTSKTSNWKEDDTLSFVSDSNSYSQEVSATYNFTASESGILRFAILTNMMNVVVKINDKELLYTDYDFIYENRDSYYIVQCNIDTPGEYELSVYLDNYIRSVTNNYISLKDVMFLTETEDVGNEEKDIIVLTSCSDDKTCVLSASLIKEENDEEEIVSGEEVVEDIPNPETIDKIFWFMTLSLILGITLIFMLKRKHV